MNVRGFSRRRMSLRPKQGQAPAQTSAAPSRRALTGPGPIWVCVPCMGRLGFLQKTVGPVVSYPGINYCLVDYSCPDRCGDWLANRYPEDIRRHRLAVERVPNQRVFHKCKAHNAGARRAISEGAEYLCFLDADTVVGPAFFEWIQSHVARRSFLIAGKRPDGSDQPSVTGLLVVHRDAFRQVGGFDESFRGWGGEDIEMRLRLFLLAGLDYVDVPLSLITPLPHADSLRTQFYAEGDIRASNRDNMRYLFRKVSVEWRGRCVRDVASGSRLWYGSVAVPQRVPTPRVPIQRPPTTPRRPRPAAQAAASVVWTPSTAPRRPPPPPERGLRAAPPTAGPGRGSR